jgi:hypothetical protein
MTNLTPVQETRVNAIIKASIDALRNSLTTTIKADFQTMIADQIKTIADQNNTISEMSEKIANLEARLAAVESSPVVTAPEMVQPSQTQFDYSFFAKQLAEPKSVLSKALNNVCVNAVKKNDILADKKSKNLIVVGIPNSTKESAEDRRKDDEAEFENILKELKLHAAVKKVYRIPPKVRNTAAGNSDPLVVEFNDETTSKNILRSGKDLKDTENYKKVFFRPDRTPAAQSEFNKLVVEKNAANEDLKKHDLYNTPFRFIIRADRVVCIDTSKSKTLHGNTVHPFVTDQIARSARAGQYTAASQ